MTDKQVNALAQACAAGAMNEGELSAIIDRHHDHEKRFILNYTQSLVCGFRSDAYEGPGSHLNPSDHADPTPR